MKVFISWSGDRSHALAKVLHDRLPLILHYVEPWLSKSDIAAGERWADEIGKQLQASNFGILCITRENVESPWVLFEAGALSKSLQESKVIPLLLDLDLKDLKGPLTLFQATKADAAGIGEVLRSINKASDSLVPESRMKELFEMAWPKIEKAISEIPKPAVPTKQQRPQAEILEELVGGVRTIESRLRESTVEPQLMHRRLKRRRVHPMMVEEILHRVGRRGSRNVGYLFLAALAKEDAPWFSEPLLQLYRATQSGSKSEIEEARWSLKEVLDASERNPVLDEMFFPDEKEAYMVVRALREGLRNHLRDTGSPDDSPPKNDAQAQEADVARTDYAVLE
jgi:hypothetical protein